MTEEQAIEKGKMHLENAETLCVISDGSVYVDNDIAAMREHAKATGKDIFVLKGEKVEAEAKPVEEVKAPSKKGKKK